MKPELSIGIIGDFDPSKPSHLATNRAIEHAADKLQIKVKVTWLPTTSFTTREACMALSYYDGLWASPGSPYQDMEGALRAITMVRLFGRPLISN
jgi:CTP synthase (UTP-ammonia lyase)